MLDFVSIRCIPGEISCDLFMIDVPYIANWIYEHPGLHLNLQGIWIADPSLTYGVVQQEFQLSALHRYD